MDDVAAVLDHLDDRSTVGEQPFDGPAGDDTSSFDLPKAVLAEQCLEFGMDHHGVTLVGLPRLGGQIGLDDLEECIGSARSPRIEGVFIQFDALFVHLTQCLAQTRPR